MDAGSKAFKASGVQAAAQKVAAELAGQQAPPHTKPELGDEVYLTQRVYLLVLESQIPHKPVNLMF